MDEGSIQFHDLTALREPCQLPQRETPDPKQVPDGAWPCVSEKLS